MSASKILGDLPRKGRKLLHDGSGETVASPHMMNSSNVLIGQPHQKSSDFIEQKLPGGAVQGQRGEAHI